MSDKVVFITGCASGVGLHLADCFAQQGYRVVATDINLQQLKALAKQHSWSEDQVWVSKLDVTKKAQWQKLWGQVIERWGQIDILLNVAGYLLPGYAAETSLDQVDLHMDINVKGVMFGSMVAAESMRVRGEGHIINVASLAGLAPIPGLSLYSASKFAVRGFTLALAQEMKPLGVAVSVICPDAIETPMLTLQEDYEEAKLTFSGSKTLTVSDIADTIFESVLPNKTLEVAIPEYRGWLAKVGSTVPRMSFMMGDIFGKLGRQKQQARKGTKPNGEAV